MTDSESELKSLLRLTLTPGLGPVLIRRVRARFGSCMGACAASTSELEVVEGIGPKRARDFAVGLRDSQAAAEKEWSLAQQLGVALLPWFDGE